MYIGLATCVHRVYIGSATGAHRVNQNRIYTPYMTVYLVISLPKIPYIHRISIYGVYFYGSGQP